MLFIWMMKKGRFANYKPGFMIAVFFVVNGISRFLVEFLRLNDALIPILDPPTVEIVAGQTVPLSYESAIQAGAGPAYYFQHWHWYGFTQSQLVGVALVAVGLIWIFSKKLYQKSKV